MELKIISPKISDIDTFLVALKFEIATARSEGVRVLRICLPKLCEGDEETRFYSILKKNLRAMKQKGNIQLFAFPDSFERHTTEAVFLLNNHRSVIAENYAYDLAYYRIKQHHRDDLQGKHVREE